MHRQTREVLQAADRILLPQWLLEDDGGVPLAHGVDPDQRAVPAGFALGHVMLDQLHDAGEERHGRLEMRLGVQSETAVGVEESDRSGTTISLDTQGKEKTGVGGVAD